MAKVNPFVKKSGKKPNAFTAKAKAKRGDNGSTAAPAAPKVMGIEPFIRPPGDTVWARRAHTARLKTHAESDKHDFTDGGLRYCNVREWDGFWTVDLVNGDETIRFDNRSGSWLIDVGDGFFKEARATIVAMVHARWKAEVERQGRDPLLRGQPKKQAPKPERKRKPKEEEPAPKTKSGKKSPQKSEGKKPNPFAAKAKKK